MSTVNPDERSRRIGLIVRPAVFVAAIMVQFLAPVAALLVALDLVVADPGLILVYVLAWTVVGMAALWVPSDRSTYLLAAYILAYIAGLFVVIALSTPKDQTFEIVSSLLFVVPYSVAAVVVVLYAIRQAAMRRTREVGVDTTATVVGTAVTGMVNYVTRQRLTLKFTDQQGVDRYLRVGRTGRGYSAGDSVPIRYDPTRPWSKRAIIVDGSGPSLF